MICLTYTSLLTIAATTRPELLGMPVQITVGAKGYANGVAERKIRATGARDELALDTLLDALTAG